MTDQSLENQPPHEQGGAPAGPNPAAPAGEGTNPPAQDTAQPPIEAPATSDAETGSDESGEAAASPETSQVDEATEAERVALYAAFEGVASPNPAPPPVTPEERRVVVRALQDTRWRAGRSFGREWVSIPEDELSPDDLARLKADPLLVVIEPPAP